MNADTIIGRKLFTDGNDCDLYLDAEGQYVLDDGEKVRGVWLLEDEADVPVFVRCSC